jgi:hypothetical protein
MREGHVKMKWKPVGISPLKKENNKVSKDIMAPE